MTRGEKKLNNIKRSDIIQLGEREITTINNCLVGVIAVERYSKFFFEWYWKNKIFILTDISFILKSRYYYYEKTFKLKNLKVSGIMCNNEIISFNICNKKNNKKIMSISSLNCEGLLTLYKHLSLKLANFIYVR